MVDGVWQSDGSQHAAVGHVNACDSTRPTVRVAAQSGQPTLKVAYSVSGIARKASIAQSPVKLCKNSGFGLELIEIDIVVGGAAHDLFDKARQDEFLALV